MVIFANCSLIIINYTSSFKSLTEFGFISYHNISFRIILITNLSWRTIQAKFC